MKLRDQIERDANVARNDKSFTTEALDFTAWMHYNRKEVSKVTGKLFPNEPRNRTYEDVIQSSFTDEELEDLFLHWKLFVVEEGK